VTRRHLLEILGLAAVVAAFVALDAWSFVSDTDRVEAFFTERGAIGPVVFVLVMWTLQPAGVPGLVFMVPAAVVWPLPTAMALSWIGNMGASTIAFAMARWMFRDWAQNHLPTRLRVWDERLAAGGLMEVTLLRVVTGQLTPADWLLGVSTVTVGVFLVGTGIGIIPGIVLATTVGGGLSGFFLDRPLLLAVSVVGFVVVRRMRRMRRRGLASPNA
jgi:uncharacterized membrane protein YdjX (TVP38/TMEM64 family)